MRRTAFWATTATVLTALSGAAHALPRIDMTRVAEPTAVLEVGLGYKCKGPYIWQRYVPKRHPNYEQRYYDPFVGPPCRIGIYLGHGRGIVGTRVGDPLYRPYRPLRRH